MKTPTAWPTALPTAFQPALPTTVPAPAPTRGVYRSAVVRMAATGSFDGTGLSVAARPAPSLGDHSTGLPPRAAPV